MQQDSGVNTVLLVLILVVVVGALVWFFGVRGAGSGMQDDGNNPGINVDVELPEGSGGGSGGGNQGGNNSGTGQ